MSLIVPNIADIAKRDPKLAEALQKVQDFSNLNITPTAGNKVPPPGFVNPGSPQG